MLGSVLFQTYSVWHRNRETDGMLSEWYRDREGLSKADAQSVLGMERRWIFRGYYEVVSIFLDGFNPNQAREM